MIAATLAACDSSSKSSSKSGLDAALALVPQNATSVEFTEWSAFSNPADPQNPAIAGALVSYNLLIQSDLGFKPTDATWEADILGPGAPMTVLEFGDTFDFDAVESKLTGLGYKKTTVDGRDILAHPLDLSSAQDKEWELPMATVGIDRDRHLMVATGSTGDSVKTFLAGGPSLLDRSDVRKLAGKVGSLTAAAVSVDDQACQPLAAVGARMPPAALQRLRQQFTALGTFSAFTADIVGVRTSGAASTATAALAFADAAAARDNAKARAAAPRVMAAVRGTETDRLSVDSTTVFGSVVTFTLHLSDPRVLPEAVVNRALGFDVCL
jgi:hypothetical protein